ncbi:MAG: Glutathione hydrolase proenzyme [Calditrichaeota bacterium]|nr:Glutathione hydrolase proenzyme [Calditrichota bacterium]
MSPLRRRIPGTTLLLLFGLLAATAPAHSAAPPPEWGRQGMIATAHPLATKAGYEVLEEGGNAVDAALAAIFALDVVTGYSEGLGGGEFWVIHHAESGDVACIDGREVAPAAASRDMYLDENGEVIEGLSTTGILAGGVPGSVAARERGWKLYGSLEWARLIRPAIGYASEGFVLSPREAGIYADAVPEFRKFPSSAKKMLTEDSASAGIGERHRQPLLAESLRRIAEGGADEFYRGSIAAEITRFMRENGGLITGQDLAGYEAKVRAPIHGTYRGYDVYSMPPPSSGGVHLVQMLNTLEGWNLPQFGQRSSRYYHHLGEVMELAFADRAVFLGDPAFVNVPVEGLISKDYADSLRGRVTFLYDRHPKGAGDPMNYMENPPDSLLKDRHTSHLSVIDRWGNMVAITATINTHFGSKVVLGNTGIFLNNEMDDFSISPGVPNYFGLVGSEANAIAPGKRPLSSMSPTLILKDGQPFMAVGAAGGPKIITGTLQTIVNVIDFEMDVQEAVSEPRIHHQWSPDYLFVSKEISPDCLINLRQMGHTAIHYTPGSVVQAVLYDAARGLYFGAADPRFIGNAAGVK